jgi:hypothetical protein
LAYIGVISGAVFLATGLCGGLSASISTEDEVCFSVSLIALLAGILMFIFAVPGEKRANESKRKQLMDKIEEMRLQHQQEMDAWDKAMSRWNQLYYCGRDDCVFIPGAGTSAPPVNIKEYLNRAA